VLARRHREVSRTAARSSTHTFTRFNRLPEQLDVLAGPVLDFLGGGVTVKKVRVVVLAGSTGAEAYTLASTLSSTHPTMEYQVVASDLHQDMIDLARSGLYSRSDVLGNGDVSQDFLDRTFERVDGTTLRVRPELRARVSFERADLLDDSLAGRFAPADLVFAQNVFFHLPPDRAEQAFRNVARILGPRACLFIDGMDLDMKVSLTRELGLAPLEDRYREIYVSSRRHIPDRWWGYYYGCEPFRWGVRDRLRRYSTIFMRSDAGGSPGPVS
jgi:chemotaxis protein methyltransferase CheR